MNRNFSFLENKYNIIIIMILILTFFLNFYNWNDFNLSMHSSMGLTSDLLFQKKISMLGGYVGFSLLEVISSFIFGMNLFSIRLAMSLSLTLTVLFTYFFVKDYYNKNLAILSSLILMLIPSFIFERFGDTPYVPLFFILFLFLFYRYYKYKKNLYLYLGALVLGYSIYLKLIFIYAILALIFSYIILLLFSNKKIGLVIQKKKIILFSLAFLIGLSPFLIFNITAIFKHEPNTIQEIYQNFFITSSGYRNFQIIKNLKERLEQIKSTISENVLFFSPDTPVFFSKNKFSFNLTLLALSMIISIIFGCKKDIFLILTVLFFSFSSIFTVSTINHANYLSIYPFFSIIISRGIFLFKERVKYGRYISYLLILLFILINFRIIYIALNLFKDQKFIEENIPSYSMVVHKIVENLDADLVVLPCDSSDIGYTPITSYNQYITVDFVSFCYYSRIDNSDNCKFICENISEVFENLPKNRKIEFILPFLPENYTIYKNKQVVPAYICDFGTTALYIYNNTNTPFDLFLKEVNKRGIKILSEKNISNYHGDIYKIISVII